MATDLRPAATEIEQQYTDLFYGRYMAEQWGIEAGYGAIPVYLATSRLQLLRWQQDMDCSNSLCALSRRQGVTVVSMASGCANRHLDQPCCDDNARFQPL